MKLFCEYNRFDLEQDLIKAWEVTGHIEELIRQHLDRPEGPFSEDELANRLQGIQYVAELNFQRIWDGYEMMIKQGRFAPTFTAVPDVEIEIKPKKGKKK